MGRTTVSINTDVKERYAALKSKTKFSRRVYILIIEFLEKEEFKRDIKRPA